MWQDPIVAEVHRAREKLAKESNYDIRLFFAGLRQRQMARQKGAGSNAGDEPDRHSRSPAAAPQSDS